MAEKQVGKKAAPAALSAARLPAVFWSFFKIGAFTFGGGWAMIPLIRKELVSKKNWIDDTEFVDLLAVAQSAPGPIAINVAVITGYKVRRVPGALVAALGASLPSFLVILAFATVLLRWKGSPAVEAVFKGMRPAIFGLLISAVWQVGKSSIRGRTDVVVAAIGGILLLGFNLNPIVVVGLAALAGVILGRLRPSSERSPEALSEKGNPGEGD